MTGVPVESQAPPLTRPSPVAAPELSVVVPTFNEQANVPLLIARLQRTLDGIDWEVIVVDDNSPDGTAAAVRALGESDARVRCIRRIGRRGLAGACLEGMLASQARYVAVMDADLQHDETVLADMLARLRRGDVDLAVASRYAGAGSAGGLAGRRISYSRWSTGLARRLLRVSLSDPMSGFFMMRRTAFEELAPSLSSQGFKILLDIVATSHGALRIAELPYVFRERQHGESKLDARIVLDFFALVLAKLTNDAISFRFLMFCFVGLTGVFIHMAALAVGLDLGGLGFAAAQATATVAAIAWNFTLNNALTYRDQRLTGWPWIGGILRFELICAVGALSNVGVASWIYDYDPRWWVAGLAGAVMGAVWNYVMSAAFVWRAK